jgi:hypothetical protein
MSNAIPSPLGGCGILLLFLVVVGGCASEDRECADRSGTYQLRYFEQTGGCGPIPDQVLTVDEMTTIDPACSGRIVSSADNCEVTLVDFTCAEPGIGPGVTSTANAKVDWSTAGDQGDGVFNLVVRDGTGIVLCQSSYEVEYDRL